MVGSPDDTYGEIPVAHVALREGAVNRAETLRAFLEPRLARYKLPAEIHIHAGLPKNSVGKIVKGQLRES